MSEEDEEEEEEEEEEEGSKLLLILQQYYPLTSVSRYHLGNVLLVPPTPSPRGECTPEEVLLCFGWGRERREGVRKHRMTGGRHRFVG